MLNANTTNTPQDDDQEILQKVNNVAPQEKPTVNVSTPVKPVSTKQGLTEATTPDSNIQKPFQKNDTPKAPRVNSVPVVTNNITPVPSIVNDTPITSIKERQRSEVSTTSEADPTGFKILKVHPANEKPSLNSDDESSQVTPTHTESSTTPTLSQKLQDKTLQLDNPQQPLFQKCGSEGSESTPRLISPSDETIVKPMPLAANQLKAAGVATDRNFIVLSNANSENTVIQKIQIVQPVQVSQNPATKKPKSRWVKANPHGTRGRWTFHDKQPPKGNFSDISSVNASISNNSINDGRETNTLTQSSNQISSNLTSSNSTTQVQNVGVSQDVNKKNSSANTSSEIHNVQGQRVQQTALGQQQAQQTQGRTDQKMPHVPIHRPVTVKAVPHKNIPPIAEENTVPVKAAQSTPQLTSAQPAMKLKVQLPPSRNASAQERLAAGEQVPRHISVDLSNSNDISTSISDIIRIQHQHLEAMLTSFVSQHISQKYEAKINYLESQLKNQAEAESKIQKLEKRIEELEACIKERDLKCNPSQFAAQNRKIKRLELEKKQLEDSNLLLKSQVENRDKDFLEYHDEEEDVNCQGHNA